MKIFSFEELHSADLVVDAIYRGGEKSDLSSEVLSKLLKVGNAGGFRYRGSLPNPRLVVLTSNDSSHSWPDTLDPESGVLEYYGDNRKPGPLLETSKGGNKILEFAFGKVHGTHKERAEIPIFLYFSRWGSGRDWRFRGLIVPGGPSIQRDFELLSIWRTSEGSRFQNFKASFTVLDIPIISRKWLLSILDGTPDMQLAPVAFKDWITSGRVKPLLAPKTEKIRTREQQLPVNRSDEQLLTELISCFPPEKAHHFEPVALALWQLCTQSPVIASVTRQSADGGFDAFGTMNIGPESDPLPLEFALEAKCYTITNSVGVKETSRLISRLRTHQFGVFVTTSYIAKQAYTEIREDKHPVVVISGADIIRILQRHGVTNKISLHNWLETIGKD